MKIKKNPLYIHVCISKKEVTSSKRVRSFNYRSDPKNSRVLKMGKKRIIIEIGRKTKQLQKALPFKNG